MRISDQRLRASVFWLTGAFMLVAMLVLVVMNAGRPAERVWGISASVSLMLTGWGLHRAKGKRIDFTMGVVGVAMVLGVPFILWLDGSRPQLGSALLAFPLVLTVLFFDRFYVVAAVATAGLVGNGLLAFTMLKGEPRELIAYLMLMLGMYGVAVLAAWANHRSRAAELKAEGDRNQALRLSENRRAQAERLAIVGRLAAGVAHELNNPLAYVKSNVTTLHRELLDPRATGFSPHELGEVLDETIEGIERIAEIVSDLKSLSRDDKTEIELIELSEVVRATLRLAHVRLSRQVHLEVAVDEGLPPVRANRRKLSQVLLNLLINAGDVLEEHCNSKGIITISATVAHGQVRIDVTDSGPGIPPEVLPRLFEPFFTTKPPGKGTGLGLTLSREYAQSFGASLSAHNVPGAGACFSLSLLTGGVTGETPIPHRSSNSGLSSLPPMGLEQAATSP